MGSDLALTERQHWLVKQILFSNSPALQRVALCKLIGEISMADGSRQGDGGGWLLEAIIQLWQQQR